MSTYNLPELREQSKALSAEIDRLSQVENPSDEEIRELADAIERVPELAAQVEAAQNEERAKNLETIRSFAKKPGHVENEETTRANLSFHDNTRKDPFDLTQIRLAGWGGGAGLAQELRSRAHDAIEQAPEYMPDQHRQRAAALVDRDAKGRIAQHILEHGSPDYVEAFFHYMNTGQARAALSTTSANGGYLIPFHLDPTIILTSDGSTNPFRQIARVETITTNEFHGVSSAGVTGEWLAEATEAADGSPTFAQPTIPVHKASAYVQASFEVTQDSDVASSLGEAFASEKDDMEAAAFATGSGSGQPTGIVTALNLVTASRVAAQTNAAFGAIDIFALVNDLPARHQNNCSWVAHWSIFNLARQLSPSGAGSSFWADLGPGIPSQLLGRPTYTSSAMQNGLSAATSSTDEVLVLGDFARGYTIVDRVGLEVVYNPLVLGSSRRPTGEVGWMAFWRVGGDSVNANAFRMLVA